MLSCVGLELYFQKRSFLGSWIKKSMLNRTEVNLLETSVRSQCTCGILIWTNTHEPCLKEEPALPISHLQFQRVPHLRFVQLSCSQMGNPWDHWKTGHIYKNKLKWSCCSQNLLNPPPFYKCLHFLVLTLVTQASMEVINLLVWL